MSNPQLHNCRGSKLGFEILKFTKLQTTRKIGQLVAVPKKIKGKTEKSN